MPQHETDARMNEPQSQTPAVKGSAGKEGEFEVAIAHYRKALELMEQLDDIQGIAQTLGNLGLAYADKGEWEQAIAHYRRALGIMEEVRDMHGTAQTLNNLGLAYTHEGLWDPAIEAFEKALILMEHLGETHSIAHTYNNIGSVYAEKAYWELAILRYQKALVLMEQVGDIRGVAQTFNNLASVYANKGDWELAIANFEKALALMEQVGDMRGVAQTFNILGMVHMTKGETRPSTTQEEIRSEVAIPVKRGDEVIGVLNVGYSPSHRFSGADLESLNRQTALTFSQLLANEVVATSDVNFTIKGDESRPLTPNALATSISPLLNAIEEIQHIIDEVSGRKPRGIRIRAIRQRSPISVSLQGAAEAVQVVKETVVPWRRKHAETMARLLEQEKQTEIESKKAEVLEKRANASKGRAEAEKLITEAIKQHEEAEKMKLENEKLRLDLNRSKIEVALDILNQIAPRLPEADKIAYLVRLLPPLDIVVSSNLEITSDAKDP